MWHVLEKREITEGFCWVNLMELNSLEDWGIHGNMILKWILRKLDRRI
jgi:hypothetical protein